MQRNADENVHSFAFSEALDRIYLLMIFLSDIVKEFGGELGDRLKAAWRQIDLSWIDDVNDQARRRADEDRTLHAAS